MRPWTLAEIERDVILCCLWRQKGNVMAAARELDVSYRGIRNKLKFYEEAGELIPRRRMFD